MAANAITIFRIFLAFFTLLLFQKNSFSLAILSSVLVAFVIILDMVDGIVARKRNEHSEFGAVFDISGDRIVESIYWVYFAFAGAFTFWFPLIIITRGWLTDTIRAFEVKKGKTPFGKESLSDHPILRFFVASRISRAVYGGAKFFLFVYAGILLAVRFGIEDGQIMIPSPDLKIITLIKDILAWTTMIMCVIRGIPVLWDGRKLISNNTHKGNDNTNE